MQQSVYIHPKGFPDSLVVKDLPASAGDVKRCGFDPWVGKIPWRRKWQPTLVFLPGTFQGWKSLVVYNPCGCKELDRTEHVMDWLTGLVNWIKHVTVQAVVAIAQTS